VCSSPLCMHTCMIVCFPFVFCRHAGKPWLHYGKREIFVRLNTARGKAGRSLPDSCSAMITTNKNQFMASFKFLISCVTMSSGQLKVPSWNAHIPVDPCGLWAVRRWNGANAERYRERSTWAEFICMYNPRAYRTVFQAQKTTKKTHYTIKPLLN
jgi:hypothetical protein